MQQTYIAGTEDAYARLCARIWLTSYSRKKDKYKIGSSSHACSILLNILENDANCREAYSRYVLQLESINVAHQSRSNYDHIHASSIAYSCASCYTEQENMERDQHTNSVGVRGIDHDIEHRIHVSERVTRVKLSVYLDLIQAIRQHHVQLHPLSMVSKTHPYRLCEYNTETGEYACILYREDALNFIHSYNISGPGIEEDFILWLIDSGTARFLSNLIRPMFIQLPCHTTINGVGQAV